MGAPLFFIWVENKSVSVVVYGRTVALTPRATVFFYFVLIDPETGTVPTGLPTAYIMTM